LILANSLIFFYLENKLRFKFDFENILKISIAIEVASFCVTSSKQRVTTILYIRGRESAWNALDGDLGFRGHMVSPCFTATKKALQKRRQKLGVSASDISGLKLSRRSKHVLPAWFCAPCLTDWMVGRSARWCAYGIAFNRGAGIS